MRGFVSEVNNLLKTVRDFFYIFCKFGFSLSCGQSVYWLDTWQITYKLVSYIHN